MDCPAGSEAGQRDGEPLRWKVPSFMFVMENRDTELVS